MECRWVLRVAVQMVVLGMLLGGPIAAADVTPTALPFDAALSMYVGHSGTWYNCNAGEEETAEIEDVLAAFEATETFSEDVDLWADHQINDPPSPTGWLFFCPVEEEEMSLHVVVRDTQNRLGDVVVRDRATSQTVGVLSANEAGSEIDGSLEVSPIAEAYSFEVRDQTLSNVMFTAAANKPWVEDVIVLTHEYGWVPNCGDDHGGVCPGSNLTLSQPYGDPKSTTGKTSTGSPSEVMGCAGPTALTNDSQSGATVNPKYWSVKNKQIVTDLNWTPPPSLFLPAAEKIVESIGDARDTFLNGAPLFPQGLQVKPFSVVTGHWPMTLTGTIVSLIYLPYRGLTAQKTENTGKAEGKVDWSSGEGKPTPSISVTLARTWGAGDRRMTQCGDPIAIGDVWGLTCSAFPSAGLYPEEGITRPFTITLYTDIPDGPIGGLGRAERLEAWTNPAPPAAEQYIDLTFTGGTGQCCVNLAKGWNWKATGKPGTGLGGEDDAYSEGTVGPFSSPGTTGQKTINSDLLKLLTLKVRAVLDQGGGAAESEIALEMKQGTNWVPAGGGDTVQEGNAQIWTHMGPVGPGTYRVRGRAKNPEGAWGAWVEFGVIPAAELIKTVTVPQPGN